jgi:hypothetical protein
MKGQNMTKLHIVLRGEHGGELSRKAIRIGNEQDAGEVIRGALIQTLMSEGWSIHPGDTITIEEV